MSAATAPIKLTQTLNVSTMATLSSMLPGGCQLSAPAAAHHLQGSQPSCRQSGRHTYHRAQQHMTFKI